MKEAVSVPMVIVMAWELGVLEHENKDPLGAILYWQMAIMTYASMRFDDAFHTSPTVFAVGSESLSGLYVWCV